VKRRAFVESAGAGVFAALPTAARAATPLDDAASGPERVYQRRVEAAAAARAEYVTSHGNGDEARYAASGYIGSYAKGLPHQSDGTVFKDSFESMVRALEKRTAALLEWGASARLQNLVARYDTRLLPQAYIEGCPTHPSYPAGHATFAGTGVTVLKAMVDETYVLPAPMIPSRDGLRLEPYKGPPLTLGSELDKLAANCALGRGTAGVHFRTDSYAGLRIGEAAALSLMRDRVIAIGEGGPIYKLRSVDGARVKIAPDDTTRVPKAIRSS
jgi:hypothetical protein